MNGKFQPNTGSGGAVLTSTPVMEYLRPDIMRPDLYESKSFIVGDIHGPSNIDKKHSKASAKDNYMSTLIIIFVSAIIFVTIVSWCDVLRSYYDSKFVNDIIKAQTKARIYYASTCTIILIITLIVAFLVWKKYTKHLQ